MRRLVTLAVLGMLGTALLVSNAFAQANPSLGKDGVADKNGQVTKIGYVDGPDTSQVKKVTPQQPLPVNVKSIDYLTDPSVTNLIASVAIDTGGTGGANFRYSAPVDVREYTSGRIIIHITAASAADTAGKYQYGVTVMPLTVMNGDDWTTVGVPISTNVNPAATDTLGFQSILASTIHAMPGERVITLQTDRTTSNYANVNAGKTVSLPWDIWLGQGARPRHLMVQVRLMSRNYTVAAMNLIPSVRVDLEGLR